MRCLVVLVMGCGRLGFDASPPVDPDAEPDATPALARSLPCDTHVLLDLGGHNPHDIIRWVRQGTDEWIVGADHYDQTNHMIERHRLVAAAGGAAAGAQEFVAQANHVDVISFAEVPNGTVLGYWDFTLSNGATILLGPGLTPGTTHDLGSMSGGNPPLGRIGGGKLLFVGSSGGVPIATEIGADAAPTGRSLQLATPADGPGPPTLETLDVGIVVGWRAGATGTCKLVVLSPDLAQVAGPVELAIAGCNDPHFAWLPDTQRIVAVAEDNAGGISAASFSTSLAVVDAPRQIVPAAHWPRIAGDGDVAWLTWAQGSPQQVGNAELDATGAVIKMGSLVGALDDTLGHFHQIDRVARETIITWTDTSGNRTFSAERLCR